MLARMGNMAKSVYPRTVFVRPVGITVPKQHAIIIVQNRLIISIVRYISLFKEKIL